MLARELHADLLESRIIDEVAHRLDLLVSEELVKERLEARRAIEFRGSPLDA